jgi:hypothetical protein
MKITIQIMVKSDEAESEVVQEVAHLDRDALRPDTLGLSGVAQGAVRYDLISTPDRKRSSPFQSKNKSIGSADTLFEEMIFGF